MTETVGVGAKVPGEAGKKKAKRKLTVPRVFTTEGVHPYDEVNWEQRDVVMTNWRDGTVNFEQRGVEFPDFWSINATNIVTSKYFRGAVGSPQRERGLRQLIDRVVKTYVKAGTEHGYFETATDAGIFEHELTWMLLHQVFSFNSPVWFNVGTTSKQQVSACFILAVDDTMESILNWYREEGLIFKGGSGAGLNLSRIRSSRELLSSGGTASGTSVVASATTGMPRCIASISDRPSEVQRIGCRYTRRRAISVCSASWGRSAMPPIASASMPNRSSATG